MAESIGDEAAPAKKGEYTMDGTVDLQGNPVLRSKRGGWKACAFFVVYGVFERMAYYGISTNLVIYMTSKLHQGTVSSSNNVTNWVGTVWITPIIGAYVADAHLGRYLTFMVSSLIYFSGMFLLVLAVSLPSLKPSSCGTVKTDLNCSSKDSPLRLGVFFAGLYIIALGIGGTKPNVSTLGADQFDEFDKRERNLKLSFFNWWMFCLFIGTLFANTILVYIQDNVGWTVGYALPTLGLAVAVAIFASGTSFYRHKPLDRSPFTKMAQVMVAAAKKWRVSVPTNPKELYELELHEYKVKGKFQIDHTLSLSFISKASVKKGGFSTSTGPWSLCPVTQVEETKQMLRMIPILIATFVPSAMLAQINTLFIKQSATLNRRMGPHFQIRPACLIAFVTITMLISVVLYDRAFVPFARRFTGNPRGISLLCRMGIGMLIHALVMLVACLTERRRLAAVHTHGVAGTLPLTVFILLPQFILMGIADAFLEVVKMEFFYDQAPEGMKSLGTSYAMTTLGVGNFLSSFLLSTTEKVTRKMDGGHGGWIMNNLNESHLDYYYAFFFILNVVNLVFFLAVSRLYVYRAEFSNGDAVEESH